MQKVRYNQDMLENSPSRSDFNNLPNRLTLFRMFLIPFVVGPLLGTATNWGAQYGSLLGWIAGWTFTVASLTDLVDGYIARKRQIITVFGSFLDPIADKFLVVSSLITLLALGRLPALVVIFLVLREIYMTSLRLLAADYNLKVPVSSMGKWKTTIQMFGIGFLMPYENWWIIPLPLLGNILVYIACLLSLYSAVTYSVELVRNFKRKKHAGI